MGAVTGFAFSITTTYFIGKYLLLEASLSNYGTKCPLWDVDAGLSSDGHRTWFRGVAELSVTSACPHYYPPVVREHLQ